MPRRGAARAAGRGARGAARGAARGGPAAPPPAAAAAVGLPGGGVLQYWWAAGAVEALRESHDCARVSFAGASAGALAAALAACDVDMAASARLAYELAERENFYTRRLGLVGVFGPVVREWLWELLPADCAATCSGRVHVATVELPALLRAPRHVLPRRCVHRDFADKADLVDCLLASAHVPYLMDGRARARFRGRMHLDGSALLRGRVERIAAPGLKHLWLCYADDPAVSGQVGREFNVATYEGVLDLMAAGYAWVGRARREGRLGVLAGAERPEALPGLSDVALGARRREGAGGGGGNGG